MTTTTTARTIPLALLKAVLTSDAIPDLLRGTETHDPALKLIRSTVRFTHDVAFHEGLIAACLPDNYDGNTLREVPAMVEWAIEHQSAEPEQQPRTYDPGEIGPVPLGYSGNEFYFRNRQSMEVVGRSPHAISTVPGLLELAPKKEWMRQFPKRTTGGAIIGIDVIAAADGLLQACRRAGYLNTTHLRGLGIWSEGDRIVVNLGGEAIESDAFVYSSPLKKTALGEGEPPIDTILEFLRTPNWKTPKAAELLLGAITVAVICGALPWRPHIGITGPAQSGKSTIMTGIGHILAPMALVFEGISTEAGIRQKLGTDARPVIMDEFEVEGSSDLNRLHRLLKLMRSSSSATGEVVRGTQDGRGHVFTIRAMFIVAAINLYRMGAADATRLVRLEIASPENPRETGEKIRGLRASLEGVGPRFCSRAIGLASAILLSIPKVHRALPVAQERQADNLATLAAGYAVMRLGREITEDEARALAEEFAPAVEAQSAALGADDATECLNVLLGHTVQMEFSNMGQRQSVGLALAQLLKSDLRQGARDELQGKANQLGLRVEGKGFLVANSHPGLAAVYRGTRWENGMWGSAFARLEGAEPAKQRRFADGVRSLGVWIPEQHLPEPPEAPMPEDPEALF